MRTHLIFLAVLLMPLVACQSQQEQAETPEQPVEVPEEKPDEEPVAPPEEPTVIDWETTAAFPVGHIEAQSIVLDGQLYVFGGYTDASIIPKSFAANVYDPQTETWTKLPDLPRPMTHTGVTSVDRTIYFAGGVVGSSDPDTLDKISAIREVWSYNVDTQEWNALPPLPEPRGAGELVALGNELHFFGGTTLDREESVSDHWILSLADLEDGADLESSDLWTPSAPLPKPRNHLGSTALGGKIYAIGGQTGHNEGLETQPYVHVWDPAAPDTWKQAASLPYGLGHVSGSTVALGGLIYVIGGEIERFKYSDDVLVYDPDADTWAFATSLPEKRHSASAGAIGDKLIVTGGGDFATQSFQGAIE